MPAYYRLPLQASRWGYTLGMKTAISISDEVYDEAERLAHRLKKTRSRLYTDAVREYVARHDPAAITGALNSVWAEVAAGAGAEAPVDPAVAAAARRVLERTEW